MIRQLLAILLAAGVSVLTQAQATHPSPTLLILNKDDATLSIVNPADGRTMGSVPTGEGPHEVVVSTDGALAFVSNYGSTAPGSTISVIDLGARKEIHRVDVSPLRRPHRLAFAAGRLYFTAETNQIVGRYDPAVNAIDWMIGTGQASTHMVMVNADASRMVTANIGGNSIAIFERRGTSTNWTETVVPVGRGPEGFDISPDGREVWAAHSQDGGVSIIDVATKKVTATIDLKTKRSNRLKFTPDGKTVVITDLDAGELVVVDVATRKDVKHVPLGRSPEGILMPPGGDRAYVAVTGDNFVAIVDLKTMTVTDKIEAGKGPDGMAWIGGK